MFAKVIRFILLVLLFGSTLGCVKEDANATASRIRVKLTGISAYELEEFQVEIAVIEVSFADSTNSLQNTWIPLDFSGIKYDILTVKNGQSKQIIDQYISSGVIDEVKIKFGTNSSLKIDNRVSEIILPDELKEGLIVDVDLPMQPSVISYLVLEMNASESVYQAEDQYILRPSIRAYSETFGGSLRGNVAPEEAKPRITMIRDNDTLYTIPDRESGLFMLRALHEGVWEVQVKADPLSGYADTVFTDTIFNGKIRELKSKIVLKEIGENTQ